MDFGGVAGIMELVDASKSMTLSCKDSRKLFSISTNICPYQVQREQCQEIKYTSIHILK
jgi:hypothetical protein